MVGCCPDLYLIFISSAERLVDRDCVRVLLSTRNAKEAFPEVGKHPGGYYHFYYSCIDRKFQTIILRRQFKVCIERTNGIDRVVFDRK